MHFTMNGHEYELTQEMVRSRLAGQTPGDVRQYWVEIDGVRWPVKQVLRLATGSSEFQSQTAQRHLRKLNFVVGGDSSPRDRPAGGRAAAPDFDLDALPIVEHIDARVSFSWHEAGSVTLSTDGTPVFPDLPPAPGLYRFDFGAGQDGLRTLYIGESENLRRRAGNYRNAKKDGGRNRTSRRIHKDVVAHLLAGRKLTLAVTTSVFIQGDVAADLRRKSARRLAENAAVLRAQVSSDVRVLNIDVDLNDEEGADGNDA